LARMLRPPAMLCRALSEKTISLADMVRYLRSYVS
jgi:hypothetical protein